MVDLSNAVVLGGGNTGLTTALYIKKIYPESNITVAASSKIGTIGVGEGTTPNFLELLKFLGFDESTLFDKLKATKKTGIYFDGWNRDSDEGYFHNFIDFDVNEGYAMHFDTNACTSFLKKEAIKRGIKFKDCNYVKHLQIDNNIHTILTDKGDIECSFLFDCSGLSRLIIGKHPKNKWISYGKHLKVNKAVTFSLPVSDNEYTYARAGKYGWMFEIPTKDRTGGGYLYNRKYINEQEAIEEVLDEYPMAQIGKQIEFKAGSYDKVYIGNCLAVGLSIGFLEPLEATSLMTVAHQLKMWDKDISHEKYNDLIRDLNKENMLFIYYHYMGRRNDTEFWKDYQKNIPKELKAILDSNNRVQVKNTDEWKAFKNKLQAFNWYSWSIISNGISGKKLT